jgi:transposase
MGHSKAVKRFEHLKIADKAKIIAWSEEGLSSREIAARIGRDKATINRIIQKAKCLEKDDIPIRKAGSGRPRKMNGQMLLALKRQIRKYPTMTASDLKQSLPELAPMSERSIQHHLQKSLNLPSRSAAQKPLLTLKMKKKRLAFCRAYKKWTAEDWERVMYSDESTFRCIRAVKTKVRRPSGSNRFDSRFTVKTVKHPDSVMVWGCFSGAVGRGGLYFLPKNATMNGERYQEVLENHLIPFMNIHEATHFLQDGAPCHASKKIKAYLAEQPFQVIDWPGNSPDLNPIENCWNFMKGKLKDKDVSSVPKLINEIKMLWTTKISREYFKKLSDSMPTRIKKVLAAKGECTKY